MKNENMRYKFGANWADYVKNNFSEERLEISRQKLLGFLKLKSLENLTFLDIGCGSGMHSLAAYRSGAKNILSIDYDIDSVKTTRYLHEYAGKPANWEIKQGSVLNEELMRTIGEFDVVYSWGVLHHTGDMWNAIKLSTIPLNQTGVLFIALYTTDIYINPPAEFWLAIKRKYNEGNYLSKKLMELWYAYYLFRGSKNNLFSYLIQIRDYKKSRGMSYWTDIKDWLGGWPMEFSGLEETKLFCRNELGMELLNIIAGEGNTEYLFRKKNACNYWDDFMKNKSMKQLAGPFEHSGGYSWSITLPDLAEISDNNENQRRSSMMLYENGEPLGFAHAPLQHIQQHGKSRYAHWEDRLYFSTTDNTNPNENGSIYSYCLDML